MTPSLERSGRDYDVAFLPSEYSSWDCLKNGVTGPNR
jgi:hypothetical protein